MSATAPILDAADERRQQEGSPVERLLASWVALCEDYRKRERRELIEREPSETSVKAFRQELKWLLRSGRVLQTLVADPEFPTKQRAEELAWRLRQLDDSWQAVNNPLSQTEADLLLREHFPDDPLTAKLLPQ